MIVLAILRGTPLYIWALLAALLALGLSQTRARHVGAARAAMLPIVMVLLSVVGAALGFRIGAGAALVAWAIGFAAAVAAGSRWMTSPRATWLHDEGRFSVAGSWLPLVLIVGVFACKYAAGVSVAMHPSLAADAAFATSFCLAYGVFAGLFASRGLRLLRVRQATAA